MKKEEILAKSREENRYMDEREQHELGVAFGLGGIFIFALCIAFSIAAWVRGEKPFSYTAIMIGWYSGVLWHNYLFTRKKCFLLGAIHASLCLIVALVAAFYVH